ncbi:MAG: hypothetical protein ABFS32_19080 [Bacteroidota bacterium]
MFSNSVQKSLHNVEQYPSELLQKVDGSVQVPVTYRKIWDDGFGARGWKVNATIGDLQIIASTRETGQRINTSVFIHDILDHFLSGFGVSGHRSEAMALMQLSKRTGSDPEPDYEQLVREDILNGSVNGESFKDFLPADLCLMIPANPSMPDKEIIDYLINMLGKECLIRYLVDNFFELGEAGEIHAAKSWKMLGLDIHRQTEIGRALQTLLEVIDQRVEELGVDYLRGFIRINNSHVSFTMQEPVIIDSIEGYQVVVT